MGKCGSRPTNGLAGDPEKLSAMQAELAASQALESDLLKEKIKDLYNFKILLLGAGESGKSTVVKQLCLIHNKRPSKHELDTIADSLHQNVIDCMKALLYACAKFEIELDDEKDKKTKDDVLNWNDDGRRISAEFGELITRLYNSNAVKSAYKRRAEFWLLDSCSYYLKHLDRITEVGFEPNEEDCVMARIRTTGIVVSQLEQKLPEPKENEPEVLKYQVVDVGGQRNERKKWIHCFDDVKAILFVSSLAGYNQLLFEDTSKNRLHECLELFQEITHKKAFENTPIFLFLNKKDLFESMIMETDLEVCFPQYKGGKNLMNSLEFVKEEFKKRLPPTKQVMIHDVTSVWKRDIKCAFDDVKKELLAANKKLIATEVAKIRKEEKMLSKKKAGGGGGGGACCGRV